MTYRSTCRLKINPTIRPTVNKIGDPTICQTLLKTYNELKIILMQLLLLILLYQLVVS